MLSLAVVGAVGTTCSVANACCAPASRPAWGILSFYAKTLTPLPAAAVAVDGVMAAACCC